MSTILLVALTVLEIVALVAVLALFLILITRRLRSLSNTLGEVSGGVLNWIQGDVFLVGAGAALLNRKLKVIGGVLPAMAEKAESMATQKQARVPQQANSGTNWRPAAGNQDPAIGRR